MPNGSKQHEHKYSQWTQLCQLALEENEKTENETRIKVTNIRIAKLEFNQNVSKQPLGKG